MFVTGYGPEILPERFRERPMTGKPYSPGRLLAMLAEAVGRRGETSAAEPRGDLGR